MFSTESIWCFKQEEKKRAKHGTTNWHKIWVKMIQDKIKRYSLVKTKKKHIIFQKFNLWQLHSNHTLKVIYELGEVLLNIQQFDVKRQPSIRRNIATSTPSTVPVNHIPSKRFKTKHHNQENKLSRNKIHLPHWWWNCKLSFVTNTHSCGIQNKKLKRSKTTWCTTILNKVKKTS